LNTLGRDELQADRETLKKRCKHLKIKFKPILSKRKRGGDCIYHCQICKDKINFKSKKDVEDHFFGKEEVSKSKGTGACCKKAINKKYHNMTRQILERESLSIIDGYMHIILKHCKKLTDNLPAGETLKAPLNWMDIMQIMDETITAATPLKKNDDLDQIREKSSSVLATTRIHPELLPIPLNKELLGISMRRLVERYDMASYR